MLYLKMLPIVSVHKASIEKELTVVLKITKTLINWNSDNTVMKIGHTRVFGITAHVNNCNKK